MGILNLPGPLYDWVDAALAGLMPPLACIIVWGVIAGGVSMGLYAAIAPQRRIARGKREMAEAREALDAYDGELSNAGPLIGRVLRLSLRQVRLTAWPAVVASLPLLTLLVWMSTAYAHGQYLPFGPGWLHGWEFPFFAAMILASLGLKIGARIE